MAKVKITQPADEQVPVEIIATELSKIADGVAKLRSGPLNEKALLLLIQNAMPTTDRPTLKQIRAVLDAAESLKAQYVRKLK